MNAETVTPAGANPFSRRAALFVVLFGAGVFVLLLWMIGAGMTGDTNDGGGHADGRGLNGFAAFSRLLERQGYDVSHSRSDTPQNHMGLLVLTPPSQADPQDINRIIWRRRRNGPTLVILPKWNAMAVPPGLTGSDARKGWVVLGEPAKVRWADETRALGPLNIQVDERTRAAARWSGFGQSGRLPDPKAVQSMSSGRILPLVEDGEGRVLAGYLDDGGDHGGLTAAVVGQQGARERGSNVYPVVIVAEPDLIDNYGFARRESALLASALVSAITDGEPMPVVFDLSLNGHARSANLLTLAFTPPFLAATLCLLMAALAVGWRAFLRFGPPRKAQRAIAFGKAALVANAAGLLRRSRRLHLIAAPYLDRTRERIVKELALAREADSDRTDAAIDRALAYRTAGAASFSQVALRLRSARTGHEVVRAAQDLHALERTLTT